mmetsp:Transcript_37229/g.88065  ORF Transcript_37229/g.88065 Transcript_37229/m.88065 type:complete len:204 (-) Transcript_37229:1395-2006(-)
MTTTCPTGEGWAELSTSPFPPALERRNMQTTPPASARKPTAPRAQRMIAHTGKIDGCQSSVTVSVVVPPTTSAVTSTPCSFIAASKPETNSGEVSESLTAVASTLPSGAFTWNFTVTPPEIARRNPPASRQPASSHTESMTTSAAERPVTPPPASAFATEALKAVTTEVVKRSLLSRESFITARTTVILTGTGVEMSARRRIG